MNISRFALLAMFLMITSCSYITRKLQHVESTSINSYPAARALNPELKKPLIVSLAQYKSVHTRHHKDNHLAIALAASGGGYRAANFTLGILLGLEKTHSQRLNSNLLEQVDYYSSVSGGGFGVGYYLTQLHNYLIKNGSIASFSLNENVHNMLRYNTNPLRQDLTGYLFFGEDRGLELEKRLNETLLATPDGGLLLGDIFVPNGSCSPTILDYQRDYFPKCDGFFICT